MLKFITRLVLTPVLAAAILVSLIPCVCFANDKVLAKGKDFEITESYVHAVEDFYRIMSFTSTPVEYLRLAIRTNIFALEAQTLGLAGVEFEVDREIVTENSVRNLAMVEKFVSDLGYSEAYTRYLRKNYDVPEDVIESYYLANVSSFTHDPLTNGDLRALDRETKDRVRSRILNFIQKRIYDQAYVELIDKYGVVVND